MHIILEKAVDIKRDKETGMAWTWRGTGEKVAEFTDANKFMDYVREHAAELSDVIAFSGSATTISQANLIIADQLKKAGKL